MSLRGVTCPICTESFKNTDENIYSTTCGHLFHFACMREWQSRSTSCPQCRSYNPETHKIYLSFDETPEVDIGEVNDLKIRLESVTSKMHSINDQLTESEINFQNLMVQYSSSEELNKSLEEKLQQFNDSDKDFLELQKQYTDNEICMKMLQEELNYIRIQLETKEKELNLKDLEFETFKTLKTDNSNGLPPPASSVISDDIYIEKCKMLEQKLQHLTEELGKEIRNSTQLSIDKMKLESQLSIEQQKFELHKENVKIIPEKKIEKVENDDKSKKIIPEKKAIQENKNRNRQNQTTQRNAKISNNNNNSRNNNNNNAVKVNNDVAAPLNVTARGNSSHKIIICNFNPADMMYPSQCNTLKVVKIAQLLSMNLLESDIDNVRVEKTRTPRGIYNIQLIVEFKVLDVKIDFLQAAKKLPDIDDAKINKLFIKDYIEDEVYRTFRYANSHLRVEQFGYSMIFCRNNEIFAKRTRHDKECIQIHSKSDVDELLKGIRTRTRMAAICDRNEIHDEIDENYYKI